MVVVWGGGGTFGWGIISMPSTLLSLPRLKGSYPVLLCCPFPSTCRAWLVQSKTTRL